MLTEINEANFKSEVLESKIPVLVDFWGEFCAPCKTLLPVLDQLAGELDGTAKIVKIDAHANASISIRYGVRAVPNLIFFKDGVTGRAEARRPRSRHYRRSRFLP